MIKRILIFLLVALVISESSFLGFLFYNYQSNAEREMPVIVKREPKYKNIILLIGDGMGYEHLSAANAYQKNIGSELFMLGAPHRNFVRTFPEISAVTDSAAAATAIATGSKTTNGTISQTSAGVGLKTILEVAQEQGKSTGLVSTKFINDATPAAFAAHEPNRGNYQAIFEDMFLVTKPDVVIGTDPKGVTVANYSLDDYELINNLLPVETDKKIAGFFNFDSSARNSLATVTDYSLDRLAQDEDGFFLMVEGAKIDTASHSNDLASMLEEIIDFDGAVKTAYEFASTREDTLVIVTADHETGGLVLRDGFDANGYPNVEWGSKNHTSRYVPFLSWQKIEELDQGEVIDNTEIYKIMEKVVSEQ